MRKQPYLRIRRKLRIAKDMLIIILLVLAMIAKLQLL
jgi:hypothetical protein